MISAQTINQVKELAIIDIAEKYLNTSIKKSGVNFVTKCPWHKDKHPSFTLSPAKNIASCFVCDKTVGGIGLVMENDKITYPDAIKKIARDFNIKIVETGHGLSKEQTKEQQEKYKEKEALVIASSWAADWYHNRFLSLIEQYGTNPQREYPENKFYDYFLSGLDFSFSNKEKQTVAYMLSRFNNDIDLIKKFNIGFAPDGFDNLLKAAKHAGFSIEVLIKAGLVKKSQKDTKEYFRDNFIFRPFIIPIHSAKGQIVAFTARQMPWDDSTNETGKPYPKYINTSDTLIYKKSNILFGFDFESQAAIRKADKCYVVEGNTDKISLFAHGIKNVVAKSGTSLTDEQIEAIKKLTKNICLVDDGDNAGQLSMQKNGEKLTFASCNVTVLTLADGADPDSFFTSEKHFKHFEKQNERDYLIDVRAIDELTNATNIQQKKKIKKAIAELLLQKSKEDRQEYIDAIIKGTETNKTEWNKAVQKAAFTQRDKGLNLSEENEEESVQADNSKENFRKHNFYFIKKNKAGQPTGLEIDERRFLMKLKSTQGFEFEKDNKTKLVYFGFYTYTVSADENDMIFIQLKNGKMKKISINYMKRTFFQYIRLLKPIEYEGYSENGQPWTKLITANDIELLLLKKVTMLFEEKRLILFPDKQIQLLQDTIDKHYTFFKNCYVVSDRNGYKTFEYEQLKEGYVWDDAVLDRDFHEPKGQGPGVFEKFVHDISGNEWKMDENKSYLQESIRYKSLLVSGGYMLHNFTDMQRKAVILTQGRISEDDTAEGREGKTLFVESLGRYMLNKNPDESKTYIYVPGKDLKSDDKHKWQDLELNTTCVLYDDPPSWINFEDLYNLAERAFKVEKKRQENMYIKSRIFITTNRPLDRDSGSSKARSCVIELDSIYHADYTPVDKYEHYFFRDWKGDKQEEWNKFSKYVLGSMLPAYFKNNNKLLEPPSKNLYRNELLQKARRLSGSMEIVFWLDHLSRGDDDNEPYFKPSESYSTKDLYSKLMEDRDYKDNKKLKRNFTKIIKAYFDKEGISVEQTRDATGTVFYIKSGLPERIKIDDQYIVDFFNNGHHISEIETDGELTEATKDFNEKYNLSLTSNLFKKTVQKVKQKNGDLPF